MARLALQRLAEGGEFLDTRQHGFELRRPSDDLDGALGAPALARQVAQALRQRTVMAALVAGGRAAMCSIYIYHDE